MRLRFENEIGAIDIGGGSFPVWNATSVSGLGAPKKEFNAVRYGKTPGQKTKSSVELARTITIAGDIRRDASEFEIADAIRILDSPGILYIYGRMKKKKINCYCAEFEPSERQGNHTPFIMQFTCDNPFFQDAAETKISLFRRENLIANTFVLPMVFTQRYTEADIIVSGNREVMPIFRIHNTPTEISTLAETQGIEIRNETTGQIIGIDCATEDGEIITVDVLKREVLSSLRGDIIADLTDNTFLDRFWLQKGKNHIRVINYNVSEEISVVCTFNNSYLEAIS